MPNYKISQWQRKEKDVQIPILEYQVQFIIQLALFLLLNPMNTFSLLFPEQVHLTNVPAIPQNFLPERKRLTLPSSPSGCAAQL